MTVVIGLLPRTYLTRLPGKTRTKHIHSGQSGFRSLHSALTALLETNDSWCLNIDRDLLNGVVFIDLKKAFDTKYSVEQDALKWFKSYLTNRMQRCHVNNHLSSASPLNCGVP